jgi:hypothetical protein
MLTISHPLARSSYNSKTSSLTSLAYFYYKPPDQLPHTHSPCPSSVGEIDGSAPSSRPHSMGATNSTSLLLADLVIYSQSRLPQVLSLSQPPDPSDAVKPSPRPSGPISSPTLPSPGKPAMGNPPLRPMRSPLRPKTFTSSSRTGVGLLDGTSSPDSVSTRDSSDTSESESPYESPFPP